MNLDTVFLSEAAEPSFKQYIRNMLVHMGAPSGGAALQEVHATDKTYEAVASHADMYHCNLGSRIISGAPAGRLYPENIGFNGVRLGSYFVHNLRYTAPEILAEARRLELTPVNVKQGYTKCSLVVVESGFQPLYPLWNTCPLAAETAPPASGISFPAAEAAPGALEAGSSEAEAAPGALEAGSSEAEAAPGAVEAGPPAVEATPGYAQLPGRLNGRRPAVITSDRGIARTLSMLPIDILLIREGSVRLPGFPHGFLGGATGSIGTKLLFHGNLDFHPDFTQIVEFVRANGKNPVWFSGFPLTDIGSIITLL